MSICRNCGASSPHRYGEGRGYDSWAPAFKTLEDRAAKMEVCLRSLKNTTPHKWVKEYIEEILA